MIGMGAATAPPRQLSNSTPAMHCWIYRSARSDEMYLYVPRKGEFERVPQSLLERLGRLEPVMHLELHAGRRLARADVGQVMAALETQGFYLQLPPTPESAAAAPH